MSQGGNYSDDSSLPDIEKMQADVGGPVGPDGSFTLNILGGVGVTTVGVPGSNSVTINMTGGSVGTAQTIGAVTADVITLALGAVPGTYIIESQIAAFETTGPSSAGYKIIAVVRTTGAAATLVGVPIVNAIEDAALVAGDATVTVNANDAIVRVTGVAGFTIEWAGEIESTFAS